MQQDSVQEIQGLYGAFSVSERLLQKIWLRQDAAFSGAYTHSGKELKCCMWAAGTMGRDPILWRLICE